MSKETIIVILLVVVAFFGGTLFSKNSGTDSNGTATPGVANQAVQPTSAPVSIDQIKALFNDKNIVFGNKDSKLLLVEFSDPSCPYCHIAAGKNGALNEKVGERFLLKSDGGTYVAPEPEMRKLAESGKAAFVWMYAFGHGNGELATEALYCAHESGKFWDVHDRLMSAEGYDFMNTTIKNDKTQTGAMAEFLKGVIDSKTMKTCLDSGKYADRLVSDQNTAKQLGFDGTPYFLINTTPFVGAYSFTDMQSSVDAALK